MFIYLGLPYCLLTKVEVFWQNKWVCDPVAQWIERLPSKQ